MDSLKDIRGMAAIRIKQIVSCIGCPKGQKRTLKALGLRKRWCVVKHNDNLAIRGMVKRVRHLVTLEE